MVGTASNAGLRRKAMIARHEQDARTMSPLRALRLATEKAADESFSLVLSVQTIARSEADHAGLLEQIPDGVLLMLLDGPDGRVGVMTLDAALLAALIEMQTVGQVLARPQRDRPLTRTDAAMAAPLVDGVLLRMSQHLADHPDRHWACGYRFGAMIEDRRSLGLALGAPDYHVFRLPLDIADGVRAGELMLALPQHAEPGDPVGASAQGEASPHLQLRVLEAPVRLDAVLCRLSLPLADIGRLAVGDVLALPADVLREIAIEGVGRRRVATARLGKLDGMRALCLTMPGLAGTARNDAGSETAPDTQMAGRGPATTASRTAERQAAVPQAGPSRADTSVAAEALSEYDEVNAMPDGLDPEARAALAAWREEGGDEDQGALALQGGPEAA
jgi:flagellar motor switch protein FliM